jgi:uncharacterized protein YecE (DUF72 family)
MPRRPSDDQHLLFGDRPIDRALAVVDAAGASEDDHELARRLPAPVRLGTSSWAFPGWRGIVYGKRFRAADLPRYGLAAYGQHPLLRTVGLDRAFYSLIGRAEYAELAELVPEGFRFLVKAHQSVVRPDADAEGRTFGDTAVLRDAGVANDAFLDPRRALDHLIAPAVLGLGRAMGPLVFQFPPLDLGRSGRLGGGDRFLDRLAEFLRALPRGEGRPIYAVEVRNAELLAEDRCRRYADVLASAEVAHGFAVHPTLPSIRVQHERLDAAGYGVARQPAFVCRWLLGHGQGYDEAKLRYEPFDRLIDPDDAARGEIAALALLATAAGRLVWVIANNKAEGSAPLTLRSLARRISDLQQSG